MPADDLRISELIQASIYSLDGEISGLWEARVLPIAICVDAGGLSKKFGEAIAHEAQALLREHGCSETYQWGPFEGSHFTTIFGTGDELENGGTFTEKQETMQKKWCSGSLRVSTGSAPLVSQVSPLRSPWQSEPSQRS